VVNDANDVRTAIRNARRVATAFGRTLATPIGHGTCPEQERKKRMVSDCLSFQLQQGSVKATIEHSAKLLQDGFRSA
jgi:hypothetical protein